MNQILRLTVLLVVLTSSGIFLCGCGNADTRKAEIFEAVKKNDLKAVKALLVKNSGLANGTNADGFTPIFYTADNEMIVLLLDFKADINAKGKDGATPLLVATYRNDEREAAALLAHGARVDVTNNKGETPLHWAAKGHTEEMLELLLTNKADANAKDNNGETPLLWLMKYGYSKSYLTSTNGNETSFHVALDERDKEMAEALLANNADVNAEDRNGDTSLHLAVSLNLNRLAELLRQHGGTNDLKPLPPMQSIQNTNLGNLNR